MRYACVLTLLLVAAPVRADDCHSNLMIVLDRSCSMNMPPKPGGAKTKWTLAGEALQTVTTKYNGQLDFGLIMFPDQTGQDCNQDGPIYVNVGPGNESSVVMKVMSTMPTGPCVTNIKPAFDQVSTDPRYKTPYTGNGPRGFVLFISDGQQTCGGSNKQIEQSVAALYTNGYPTYVVGFGGDVDPAALNQFAMAGGVPRAGGSADGGTPLYYQADDAQQLNDALDAIVGAVSTAEFGGCPGIPCPDGRCFLMQSTCVSGFCTTPGSGGGDMGLTGGGDGGNGNGKGTGSGCNCNLGGAAAGGAPLVGILMFAGILIARGRRRS
jgi:hypothetical protein